MVVRFIILLVILLLIDWYVFQAVKTSFLSTEKRYRLFAECLHWSVAILSWGLIIFGLSGGAKYLPKVFSTYLFAFIVVLYFSKLFVVLFVLTDDIIRLARLGMDFIMKKVIYRDNQLPVGSGITRNEFINKLALVMGFIPFAGLIYGMVKGAYNIKVKHVQLALNDLPASFKGYKIVQISDIHSGSFTSNEPLNHAIEIINGLDADLFLFTGDLVNNKAVEVEPYIPLLQKIKAKDGKLSVLGNHDYGDYEQWPSAEAKVKNLETLKEHHKEIGFKLMMNENISIHRGDDKINILGIENWGAYGRFPKYGDLDKAIEGLPDHEVNILMSHDPSHWTEIISKKYPQINLTLAGHTHGFQFGIEIPGFKWSPVKYMYPHWAGLYDNKKGQSLYVNRGLGFLGYPGRLGIWPEVTLIELV